MSKSIKETDSKSTVNEFSLQFFWGKGGFNLEEFII